MRADQLVGIRVVGDDVAGAGDGHRFDGIRWDPDCAGELDGAVLVGVLEADVQDCGRFPAVHPFLELFLGDTFDGHELFSLCLR